MKKTIIFLSIIAACVLSSCTKGFEELNTNPNQDSTPNPEYFFNTSVYQTLNAEFGAIKKILLNNYAQYCYGQTNQMGRYGNVITTNDSYFKNFYNYALLPLEFIEQEKANDAEFRNRVYISRIWKYYLFSQVESIWGPVPMSAALSGKTTIPYDSEETIYTTILEGLKECADNIRYDGDYFIVDPIFKQKGNTRSDLLKWVKFANSLRLRLAVRIANADNTLATRHISDVMEDETHLMESNDDNCIAVWGDNEGTRNYYYDYFIIQTTNLDKANSAGEALLMHTAPYGDPRLPKFFTPCTSSRMPENFHWAPWWGKPKTDHVPVSGLLDSSNPHSGVQAMDYSVMLDSYFKANYAQTIMSYAEVELLKAEVAHFGWANGLADAKEYYDRGIRASMSQFGVADDDVNKYLITDGVEYGTYSDIFSPEEGEKFFMDYLGLSSGAILEDEPDPIYHQIIMQQYIAMFGQDLDGWTLLRRSQVLDIPPHYQPETGYGAVNAGSADVSFAYVPQRLVYPGSELQDNANEVQTAIAQFLDGQDTMDKKLWWAKPQLINQRLKKLVDNYNQN